jgi:nitroreductase
MTVTAALMERHSVRAFLKQPVARETIRAILEAAKFAPSGSNIQPWEVHVVSGESRERLVSRVQTAFESELGQDRAEYDYYPPEWREPYLGRRRACGWGLYNRLGILKGDRAGGRAQELRNFQFFDAPVGLFFFIDRDLGHGSWMDSGMFIQSVMLAAIDHGLSSCPQAAWLPFHRIIRDCLRIPQNKLLLCGMALGFADPRAAVHGYRPERLAVDEFTHWHLDAENP